MAFERPTIDKLVRRAKADIALRLPGADANLRGSPEEVLAIIQAGMTHGLHGHLKWLSRQLLPDISDDEFLLRHADILELTRIDAAPATGSVTISGSNGSTCPAGTVWQRSDGTLYSQDADATIASGTAVINVTATSAFAGAAGNADVGTKLSIASPVSGINASATVGGSGLVDGIDLEEIEALRARLLTRIRSRPKGGGPGDYVSWALEVSGVTRAWQYANQYGPGTTLTLFVMDDQEATIIPDSTKVAAVQAHIVASAPVTADPTVLAPTATAVNITLHVVPDTAAVRASVEAAIAAFIQRVAEPGSTILLSQLNEAISIATGETDHTLTIPAADFTTTVPEIAVLGTITWV